ncbi:protein of unknown function [Blastococcus aurantiacus]|uniref:DUF4345 domain-containing protein n=1 Tax=Blastococcus aurantiacus TaxID=1550231 RepID=A0A1G7LT30_9ACTN|nr:DUF4345 family protein [Blastococcus aurantiacus]SDF52708.1 protein of unknown function [Blastococcus aurantiacus]
MADLSGPELLLAGTYAAIGVGAAVRPDLVPALFGGTAGTPEARTEVRAVYAGIPLALAASVVRAATAPPARRNGVLTVVRDASAGMALARLGGAVLARRLRPWPTGAFLALEAGLAVAASRARGG